MEKYLKKLEQELSKFKFELEADSAGITEILEQRENFIFIVYKVRSICTYIILFMLLTF